MWETYTWKSPSDLLVQGGVPVHLAKARSNGTQGGSGIRGHGFCFLLCLLVAGAKTVKASALGQFSEFRCSWPLKGQEWVAVRGAEGAPALGLPLHLFAGELAWAAARNTL